ncbi:MAG: N-6 DNA methylase, partial [Microgenomates group bacterium]
QNSLRKQDIEKVVEAHDRFQDIEKYARVVDMKEIKENEYNLNVRRYIDSSEEKEQIDVKQTWKELKTLEAERVEIDKKVNNYLIELGYDK